MIEKFPGVRLQGRNFLALRQPIDSFMILMHGLGADANDLFPLCRSFGEKLPHMQIFVPNAPLDCTMSAGGYQWFDFLDRSAAAMHAGVSEAAEYVNELIDHVMKAYNLPAERIILAGFSQGAMTAIHTGLRRKEELGAILAYSGMVIAPSKLEQEMKNATPVCVVHGKADPIVPFAAFEDARDIFKQLKIPHKAYANDKLGHSIDRGGIELGVKFTQGVFAAQAERNAKKNAG